jgi:hypothetical protein
MKMVLLQEIVRMVAGLALLDFVKKLLLKEWKTDHTLHTGTFLQTSLSKKITSK